jgi:hypothetical protein
MGGSKKTETIVKVNHSNAASIIACADLGRIIILYQMLVVYFGGVEIAMVSG